MTTKKSATPAKKKPALDDKSVEDKAKKKATAPAAVAKVRKGSSVAAKAKKKAVEEEPEDRPVSLKPFVTAPRVTPPPPPPPPVVVAAPPPPPPAPKKEEPKAAAQTPAAKTDTPAPAKPKFDAAPKKVTPAQKPAPVPVRPKEPPKKFYNPPPPAPKVAPRPAPVPVASSSTAVSDASTKKKIKFNEMMTVKDLAAAMDVKIPDVIKKLLTLGTPASINQRLENDIAALVADGFGFELEFKSIYVEDVAQDEEDKTNLKPRSPVVTVMGHVDHGKTSLLDAIRSARVAEREAGGITQHIGAYQVATPKGTITFLDTPGHEAFTAMRARGAMATDLVILVVAADDSVMPQTIEAIDHARAADVPIVVAINKVDLPTANVQKVKQELSQHNLLPEDWGGKTVMVEVSAKARTNIEKLLEMILLEAELLELKANPDRPAKGVVLEARLDPKRGITATAIIQTGTLRVGDAVVCGLSYGRVKAMTNDARKPIESAGPSAPVEILGLNHTPQVGDQLAVVGSEREAREIAEHRQTSMKEAAHKKASHLSLESLHSKIAEGQIKDLPIILKADVQGSLQAIQDSLGKISGAMIQLRFVHMGIGNINESDVLLAEASDAIVFGFHVKVDASAEVEAKKTGVDLRTYQIIYEMLADIKAAMEGLLQPEERDVVKGRAQVKDVFPSSKFGAVAGCMVLEGKIARGNKTRVVRGSEVVGTGTISSLRRFKDDVKEVEKGYECGISVEGIKSFNKGDVIEVFVMEKHARRLDA